METLVGIAELKVSRNPGKLITIGLGSCVGVVLYDPVAKVGALIHAMLPEPSPGRMSSNKAKFVSTAIPSALEEMAKLGARRERVTAKLIGGAQMFPVENNINIGAQNVEAAEKLLKNLGINIAAKDTGGTLGRTVELDVSTGRVLVKTAIHGSREL